MMWTQTASMSVCVSVYVRAHPLYIQYVLYHICGELLSNVYDGNTRSKSFVAGHECIRLNRTGLNTGSGFFFFCYAVAGSGTLLQCQITPTTPPLLTNRICSQARETSALNLLAPFVIFHEIRHFITRI